MYDVPPLPSTVQKWNQNIPESCHLVLASRTLSGSDRVVEPRVGLSCQSCCDTSFLQPEITYQNQSYQKWTYISVITTRYMTEGLSSKPEGGGVYDLWYCSLLGQEGSELFWEAVMSSIFIYSHWVWLSNTLWRAGPTTWRQSITSDVIPFGNRSTVAFYSNWAIQVL